MKNNVKKVFEDEILDKDLKVLYQFRNLTDESRAKIEEGYEFGKIGSEEVEVLEKLKDMYFKRGYEIGYRQKQAIEYKKAKEMIVEMVKNNIPFELAPPEVKLITNASSLYVIEQLKSKKSR